MEQENVKEVVENNTTTVIDNPNDKASDVANEAKPTEAVKTEVKPQPVTAEEDKAKAIEEDKAKQTREKNSEFARLRREKEAKEQEIVKIKEEAYKSALIESVDGINPYTGEKIVDDADYKELVNMRKIAKEGGNPVSDYSKFMKKWAKENEALPSAEVKKDDKWFEKDREEFEKAYPNTLDGLVKDEVFNEFAEGFIKSEKAIPLKTIYESYMSINKKIDKLAEQKANELYAKKIASPGSLTNKSNQPDESLYSRSQLEKMSQQDIISNIDKVNRSYDAIRNKAKK